MPTKNKYAANQAPTENKASAHKVISANGVLNTNTSFLEMENDLLIHSIKQTPEERLAENKILADASFGIKNVKQRLTTDRILEFSE